MPPNNPFPPKKPANDSNNLYRQSAKKPNGGIFKKIYLWLPVSLLLLLAAAYGIYSWKVNTTPFAALDQSTVEKSTNQPGRGSDKSKEPAKTEQNKEKQDVKKQDDQHPATTKPAQEPTPNTSPSSPGAPSSPTTPSTPPSSSNPSNPTNPDPAPSGCQASVGFYGGARDPWGDCWPGQSNTGVPSGVALSNYTGPCTITVNNTVIDAKLINCRLEIGATGVVIKRNKIIQTGLYGINVRSGASATIEDVEIDGQRVQDSVTSSAGTAVNGQNYTLRRVNIHHVYEGPRVGSNVTIEDSYIHHLIRCQNTNNASCHVDAMQSTHGSNIVIRHNTILAYNPDHNDPMNASYIIKSDFGDINNVLVEKNLMNGGNYTIYVYNGNNYTTRNVTVRDNYFGTNYRYGTHAIHASTNTVWQNNRSINGNLIAP